MPITEVRECAGICNKSHRTPYSGLPPVTTSARYCARHVLLPALLFSYRGLRANQSAGPGFKRIYRTIPPVFALDTPPSAFARAWPGLHRAPPGNGATASVDAAPRDWLPQPRFWLFPLHPETALAFSNSLAASPGQSGRASKLRTHLPLQPPTRANRKGTAGHVLPRSCTFWARSCGRYRIATPPSSTSLYAPPQYLCVGVRGISQSDRVNRGSSASSDKSSRCSAGVGTSSSHALELTF
jgi:hypothetical protein